MKVMVFGATGLLGRAIVTRFKDAGADVVPVGHRRSSPDIAAAVDARDRDSVSRLIRACRPDVVVNAIGERRTEYWTPSVLNEVNVRVPVNLADCCAKEGSWLIHISTDYVFDGVSPPYAPKSVRNPINLYGKSKMMAEDQVLESNPAATLVRLPVLVGPVQFAAESNLTALVPLVVGRKPSQVDDWAIRYPTYTSDVADVLLRAMDHDNVLRGIICHCSGLEALTKYQMACMVADHLGVAADHLSADPSPNASRPRDTRLDCGLLEGLGIATRTPRFLVS